MSSSPTSSHSSTPTTTGAASLFYDPELSNASFRPHGNLDTVRSSEAGPAFDKRTERRRPTLTGSDRKRRLVNTEGNVWSRRAVSGPGMDVGPSSSSRPQMDSRHILRPSAQMNSESGIPGASYATAIDLSSSPPTTRPQRPDVRRESWARASNDFMEYIRPHWQPDSEVTNCPICSCPFSFWYRKHHCRKCGRVVCASCSPHRITIPRQYIVHPPDPNRTPATALMAPRTGQTVDREVDDPAQSPAALNPALGGGEEVRLCNPCVPDPNPEPPHGYGTVRAPGEPRSGSYGVPGHSRHRSYHSFSSTARPSVPDNFFPRPGRRTVGSSDYPGFSQFGGSYGSRFHERPDYGSFAASRFTNPARSSARSLPTNSRTAVFGAMPQVDERDLCPVCDSRLPPSGESGNEDAREAHIRECIEGHGRQGRSPSHRGSPVSPHASSSVRMIAFAATEKDCMGEDGTTQECTICMEDYEPGQPLVRLECLCKFHKRCIVEWFERKKECPVHKVS